MARMLAAMEGSHCPSCHGKPGPDCADRGKGTRHRKRIEQRQVLREADACRLVPLSDRERELAARLNGGDCQHGCNGDCVTSGGWQCNFTCHAS